MNFPYKTFDGLVLKKKNNIQLIKGIKIPRKIPKGKVLIKIFYSWICRSQLMEIKQLRGKDKFLPHLLGHEATGVVISVGQGVKKIKKGDHVIASWINSKGANSGGMTYSHRNKKINAGPITTFSNFSILSENKITKVGKSFPKDIGVVFGCAALTGMGMVLNEVKIKKNNTVLLSGLGGIGFFIYAALKSIKIKNIFVIDNNPKKILLGKKLKIKNIFSSYKKINSNKKFDFCFDSTGSTIAIEKSISLLKNTGELIFASHPPKNHVLKIDPFELIKGKKIRGSWGGNSYPERDIKKFYRILKKNNFLNKLNLKIYNLKNYHKALLDFERGRVLRPVLRMF